MDERMSGSCSNVATSISIPVESSEPVLGHLNIRNSLAISPSISSPLIPAFENLDEHART